MHQTRAFPLASGYWTLLGGLLILLVMSGVGFYAFGVFFKPIHEEFNWGRGVTSAAFLVFYLVQAIAAPFIGRLTDRYGAKTMLTVGGCILSAGLALLSLTVNLLHFYVAYGIVGLGCSATGMIPVSAVISNWFTQRRGIALGVVSSGMGMGGLVLPVLIAVYLIPNVGWRTAYAILAAFAVLCVTFVAQIVIQTPPKAGGRARDKVERVGKTEISAHASDGWRLTTALQTAPFWLIASAYGLFQLSHVGTLQHLINHLTDIGFPVAVAAATLSAVSLISAGGKVLFGYVTDRLAATDCAVISFLLGLAATVLLINVTPAPSILLIGLYVLTFGLAIGGWAPVTAMLISTHFGVTHYGAIFGAFSVFLNLSTGFGPTFFGSVYDATTHYYLAYLSALGFYSVAILLILALRRLKHPRMLPSH